MIIKLTEIRKGDNGRPVHAEIWVNFDHVQSFNKSTKGADTHLKIMGQSYLFVKESPEQIENMLYPKAPEMPQEMVDDILSGRVRELTVAGASK